MAESALSVFNRKAAEKLSALQPGNAVQELPMLKFLAASEPTTAHRDLVKTVGAVGTYHT